MATKQQAMDLLGGVELFKGLSKADLRRIYAECKEMAFEPGTEVIAQDRAGGRLFIVVEGEAVVSVNGRRRNTFGPGDYFGEMAVIDGEPRSATVTAKTPLRTLTLASFHFRPLIRQHPAIAEGLLKTLSRRLREANRALSQ